MQPSGSQCEKSGQVVRRPCHQQQCCVVHRAKCDLPIMFKVSQCFPQLLRLQLVLPIASVALRTLCRTHLFQFLCQQQAGATPGGEKVNDCWLLYGAANNNLQLLLIYLPDVAECCCCPHLQQKVHQAAPATGQQPQQRHTFQDAHTEAG